MIQGTMNISYMISLEEVKGEERIVYVANYKLKVADQWVYVDSVASLNADEDAALQELFEKATAKWGITSLNAA
jgi:ABC-type transport system involved in cytochrome c biogenesis ATPase subunit